MIKNIKYILIFSLLAVMIFPALVLAADPAPAPADAVQTPISNLLDVGVTSGPYQATDQTGISKIVGVAIMVALDLIGVIFLALMLYAGYHWMTARGEEEKVEKAKDTIVRAIIGIIIVVGAYAIWDFIYNQFISK